MLRTAVASYERKLKKEISNNKKKKKQRRKRETKKDMVLNTGYGRGKKPCGRKNALAEALIVVCTIMVLVLEVKLALHHHHVDG